MCISLTSAFWRSRSPNDHSLQLAPCQDHGLIIVDLGRKLQTQKTTISPTLTCFTTALGMVSKRYPSASPRLSEASELAAAIGVVMVEVCYLNSSIAASLLSRISSTGFRVLVDSRAFSSFRADA